MKIIVDENSAIGVLIPGERLTTGTKGKRCTVEFHGAAWDGLSLAAICKGSDESITVTFSGDYFVVPWECMTAARTELKIGITGYITQDDGTQKIVITTNYHNFGRLEKGSSTSDGENGTDPTLTVWEQIQSELDTKRSWVAQDDEPDDKTLLWIDTNDSNGDDYAKADDLAAEQAARANADAEEEARAKAAEKKLSADITIESTSRANGDTAEANARTAAINAEASSRSEADALLQEAIDAEVTARTDAVGAEQIRAEREEALITSAVNSLAESKQDTLVSGTNIKTVNGNSLLGSGNLVIEGGSGGESNTFSAVYGVTTYDEVKSAWDAGKYITAFGVWDDGTKSGTEYVLASYYSGAFLFACQERYSWGTRPYLGAVILTSSGWEKTDNAYPALKSELDAKQDLLTASDKQAIADLHTDKITDVTVGGTSVVTDGVAVVPETTVTQTLTSGTEIGAVNGTTLYAPAGGGSSNDWELINTIDITEDVINVTVSTDSNGNSFRLKEWTIEAKLMVASENPCSNVVEGVVTEGGYTGGVGGSFSGANTTSGGTYYVMCRFLRISPCNGIMLRKAQTNPYNFALDTSQISTSAWYNKHLTNAPIDNATSVYLSGFSNKNLCGAGSIVKVWGVRA